MYNRAADGDNQTDNGRATGSATVIMDVEPNDYVYVVVDRTHGTGTIEILANGSGMTIFNLKGGERGPTGYFEEPSNSYGLTSYEETHDRLSFVFVRGTNSADPGAGPSANFTANSMNDYYYSNDIQYDPWNKITSILRFNEKIHMNGGITGPTSATSGGPWTIDTNNGTLQYINLNNATTGTTKYFEFVPSITNPSAFNSSVSFILLVVGGGDPALTIQWPSGTKWENDLGAPTLGSTQQVTIIPFTYLMGDGFVGGVTGWYGGADLKYSIAT
jgi:hypothetical protein